MAHRINTARLKEAREAKGLNKQETAQQLGFSQSVYLRYENGDRNPTYSVIKDMALFLGVSAEYLTDQTDDPTPCEIVVDSSDKRLSFIIETYKSVSEEKKERLLQYASALIGEK
jgi:transcriptional regulator with XRE-family HTH domain